ncbi:MAG TPA: response regulator [Anaerolineae bacterium]|nr:response regulator [Anaerolineae bacterium]HQI84049.1 response regulator [Anaerolineae bacterium]
MKVRVPLFVKILTPLIVVIILSIWVSGYRIYQASTERWQSEMDRRLEHIATFVAATVDVAALRQVGAPADIDGTAYRAVASALEQAVVVGNIDWVGIYYRKGDYLYYWVDNDYTGVGYPFFYPTPEHYAAFDDREVHKVRYTDEFGAYYGFVAPIVAEVDGSSTVIGIVEASLSAEASQLLEQRTLSRVLPVLIGGIVIAIGSAILLTFVFFHRPLQQLQRGALELVNGQLGYTIPITSHDEMGDLASTFNRMSVEIARLYAELKRYNQELEARVKARTAELRDERNRLKIILQNIGDGLVVTDPAGKIVLVNPAFAQLVAQPASALVEQLLWHVLPVEDLQTLVLSSLAQPDRVLATNITWRSPAANASPRFYNALSSALLERESAAETPDDPPEVLGAVTILHDITLEVEVDKMKTDFISTVSHELRTPLTSVVGFAKLIQKAFERDIAPLVPVEDKRAGRAAQRISDNLDIIVLESERLTRLINDVLDIAKIEAGKVEWHIDNIQIAQGVQSAVAAVSALAQDKGLRVEVDIEPELPLVSADPDRIVQVITNLLSNAIKFTDKGGIGVQVRRYDLSAEGVLLPPADFADKMRDLPAGPWLMVSVKDSGIGIAPENFQKVFEKFQQVGDIMTGRPKGTGLGLTISKEIVEYHGGRIWVESELGQGSTFRFVLPVHVTAPTLAPLIEEARSRADEEQLPRPVGNRILVVDDEAAIRELLYQELTDAGYHVLQALDGVAALTIARQERPDLIILDLMMPGIGGFDVISALRSDADTAAIPVMILSVLEDREKGYRLGADAYLTKPLDMPDILATIAKLLARAARGEGHKKVLVIDKDASLVETIARVFQEKDYTVLYASNGDEGLSRAIEEHPRIIVVDAQISKMNDYEILRTLKRARETQSAYVIVVSAPDAVDEATEALRYGADYYGAPHDLTTVAEHIE